MPSGQIITVFGKEVILEGEDGLWYTATRRKQAGLLAVGDTVTYSLPPTGNARIELVLPRKNWIVERSGPSTLRPIVANVDYMLIVIASRPRSAEALIDRYLILAANSAVQPILVHNKAELLSPELTETLNWYAKCDIPIIQTSNDPSIGYGALRERITGKASILLGASGVGKSTIVSHLIPDSKPRIEALSHKIKTGKHTTTAVRSFALPGGGTLSDAPGAHEIDVRFYTPAEILAAFKEIAAFAKQCAFRNCTHQQEPRCAVQTAVTSGQIWVSRLQHFRSFCADSQRHRYT